MGRSRSSSRGLLRWQLRDLPEGRRAAAGPHDVRLGEIGGAPFYIDADQYQRWGHPRFLIDVSPGAADGLLARGT